MPAHAKTFESLLQAVPDALLGVDRSGVIRFVNHQTELLFGYEQGDLIGESLETLVPESLRQTHVAHRESYRAAERTRLPGTDLKLCGRRQDGTEFPVDISLSPMETRDGLLVIAAVRDMTSYRAAEAVRRRLDHLASVIEYSAKPSSAPRSRASSRVGTPLPSGCSATQARRASVSPPVSWFPMIEPTRCWPSRPRSKPASMSRTSRPCGSARAARCSRSRSPSHRSAMRTGRSSAHPRLHAT